MLTLRPGICACSRAAPPRASAAAERSRRASIEKPDGELTMAIWAILFYPRCRGTTFRPWGGAPLYGYERPKCPKLTLPFEILAIFGLDGAWDLTPGGRAYDEG